MDRVIAPAGIDQVDNRRAGNDEVGHDTLAVEILRHDVLRRLALHGIAGRGMVAVEVPLPELDSLQPVAAMRGPDLEEGVVGIGLLGEIRGRLGRSAAGVDRGAVDAAIADLGHQNRLAIFQRQRMQEINRRFVIEGSSVIRIVRHLGPGMDEIGHRRRRAGGQRRIGVDADGVELAPETDLGGLVGGRRIGEFAVIDGANGRDEIGPLRQILRAREFAHLVADRKGRDAALLRDVGQMHDFRLV